MRKIATICLPLLLVGCVVQPTTQQPAETTQVTSNQTTQTEDLEQDVERDLDRDLLLAAQGSSTKEFTAPRVDYDPEAAHRARDFYLQGTRLMADPPRIDQAIHHFHLAIESYPRFFKAHFKLGIAYYHKGRYDLEITEYLKCLALEADYVPALLNLGHAYLAQDELEKAREYYHKVLDQQPKNAVARYNLGLVEYDLGKWEKSRDHLDKFLEEHKDSLGIERRKHAEDYLERILEKIQNRG